MENCFPKSTVAIRLNSAEEELILDLSVGRSVSNTERNCDVSIMESIVNIVEQADAVKKITNTYPTIDNGNAVFVRDQQNKFVTSDEPIKQEMKIKKSK